MAKKLTYKIGEACRELDIQPYVLRYWETEFPFLKSEKASAGQRVYSARELQIIRRIKELLYDEGYTIAGAKKKLEAELQQGGPRLLELVPPEPSEDAGNGSAATVEAAASESPAESSEAGEKSAATATATSPNGDSAEPEPAPTIQLRLGDGPATVLDSPSAERVQTLVRGLRDLRDQAHQILEILRRDP